MIVGVVLRNFKIYKSPTFIPVSNGDRFCGLIGRNGVGKSSILEALDFFFNNRQFKHNVNNKRTDPRECYATPIFLIEKTKITNFEVKSVAESFSNAVWGLLDIKKIEGSVFNSKYFEILKFVKQHIECISDCANKDTHYLLPIGTDVANNVSLAIFRDKFFYESVDSSIEDTDTDEIKEEKITKAINPLREVVRSMFQYVYIPKNIEPERLAQFETQEMQILLGKKLGDIVAESLKPDAISKLSRDMKNFIDNLSGKIPSYVFKTPNERQRNIDQNKIYELIIHEFFSIRELHKEVTDGKRISIRDLSSGEKQQAIFTLIYSIISEYRDDNTKTLIVAVDEPESSLHVSACYDQFEKLHSLSTYCCQVLFSSHWYGFIPAMNSGSVVNIVIDDQGKHNGHIFNIHKYREEIKHASKSHGEEYHQPLPIDVMLKSSNDFIQSILISTIEDNYNWLICEGSSDKIYFDTYLKDEIRDKKLRIIPVCTATEVKNTYNQLAVSFGTIEKNKLNGRVFLLIDTDRNPIEFVTHECLESNLKCRRIVNNDSLRQTTLAKITSNPKSPNTDVEDALNGKIYNQTLLWFKHRGETSLNFLPDIEKEEIASYYAMNLTITDYAVVDAFFNNDKGKNKILFAQKYIEFMQSGDVIPNWIQEIKSYFN